MDIKEKLNNINKQIPDNVNLVAVSKTHPVEYIIEAYNCGQRVFGENKAQEMQAKYQQLKDYDIKWHFIGHLQTNKVKYIASFVELIHSVDSLKLLSEINKQAKKHDRIIKCLLQMYIAKESTKFGMNFDELRNLLEDDKTKHLQNIEIVGLMGMASHTDDEEIIKNEFAHLKKMYDKVKNDYFCNQDAFRELSMGMSSDWKLAIENGSTIVRLGSNIFGKRNYIV